MLTLLQVKAIISVLIAFGVPLITVQEVEMILTHPVAPIVVPSQGQPQTTPEITVSPTPEPVQTPAPVPVPSTPHPTEAQVTPKIILDGVRDGNVVTFSWVAKGYKEQLKCTANGESVSQEGSKVVTSVEPYTLTISCVAVKSAAHAEQSKTE